jgi:hypothetical protein
MIKLESAIRSAEIRKERMAGIGKVTHPGRVRTLKSFTSDN